jgi:hypothetical protein
MAKGQKHSVVEEVLFALPGFKLNSDNAILLLSSQQLEDIKANIFNGIINGTIEYGKDPNNHVEARSYARSMVMNHLKKAKELNGGHAFVTSSSSPSTTNITGNVTGTIRVKLKIAPKGVNPDLLPDDLKEFAKSLV